MPTCVRCSGLKVVRGPYGHEPVKCQTCGGVGRVPAPEDRPTPRVDMVACPACTCGLVQYTSPAGVVCNIPQVCGECEGLRIVTPEKSLAWLRKHKQ